jgi:hypothetical protein
MWQRIWNWYCLRYHRKTAPRKDEQGYYLRCLDCGRRVAWKNPAAAVERE